MLKIVGLKTENMAGLPVSDEQHPRVSFCLESDRPGTDLKGALFTCGDWEKQVQEQSAVYDGSPLRPRTRYTVSVRAEDNHGETAEASMDFETGKMAEPWDGVWITHPSYHFKEKKVSPKPMRFRKLFSAAKPLKSARLYVTALGLYCCEINKKRVGEDYFTPGFTSYHHQMQYEVYDVTELLAGDNELCATVAGGWAVGSYTYFRRNRIYADRQAFLAELRILYEDGTEEVIATDPTWEVTMDGRLKEADLYDGEVYDARGGEETWVRAAEDKLRFTPTLIADYGAPVRVYERRKPVQITAAPSGEIIYDFGQNFAGIVEFTVKAQKGQRIVLRHAEVLVDGELFTEPLRTAKQRIDYTAAGGVETYSPRFTYMGFRYVGVTGILAEDIELTALLLASDVRKTGEFTCSDEHLNRMHKNIYYGALSNFVDIPTDCPQRDERLGWTGDIALFASTAAYNFDMSRFFRKWLRDVRSEQGRGGGFPMIVPMVAIYNQWEMCFPHAVDHWGDVILLAPSAEYLARGDKNILRENYAAMKKYLKACTFWAGLFSFGKNKYVWKLLHHYGDWCAPDTNFNGWMRRGKWTATCCLANSAHLLSRIAGILGETEDEKQYKNLYKQTARAYRETFLDKDYRLKEEFQTAYVLPLYYRLAGKEGRKKMAAHLADLVRKQGISTGFPGTPYLLFALADNGQEEAAFETLFLDTCPSWLYEVKAGGTTFWERWDALREDGTVNQGDGVGMVSFNHYAPGAAGDFFYRRIAGIEAVSGGYKTFRIKPVIGGGLTYARGEIRSPYGTIASAWEIQRDMFSISVTVPVNTTCELTLPDGQEKTLKSGSHSFTCPLKGENR